MADSPRVIAALEQALADWLASHTVPQELAAAMTDACAGAEWPAGLAAVSARRAGWPENEALAWGIAAGALAGALAAAGASLESPAVVAGGTSAGARGVDGGALPLLAADGLIAGAHEALSSLESERLAAALQALDGALGDGGPWIDLARGTVPPPAWPALVPAALGPAADVDRDGPWAALAEAWADRARAAPEELWDQPGADGELKRLFRAAARAARPGTEKGADG